MLTYKHANGARTYTYIMSIHHFGFGLSLFNFQCLLLCLIFFSSLAVVHFFPRAALLLILLFSSFISVYHGNIFGLVCRRVFCFSSVPCSNFPFFKNKNENADMLKNLTHTPRSLGPSFAIHKLFPSLLFSLSHSLYLSTC